MSSSSSSLQSMLNQEQRERHSWLTNSFNSNSNSYPRLPSHCQNPTWRPYLTQWYFAVLSSIEEFDGNRGTYPRSLAYSAMKIMDMYLASPSHFCPTSLREMAMFDQCVCKCLAIGCLFIVMNRRCTTYNAREGKGLVKDGIVLEGKIMPLHIFLHMCNSRQDIAYDHFVLVVNSIRNFLSIFCDVENNECVGISPSHWNDAPDLAMPSLMVSPYFFDEFKRYLHENFSSALKDNENFFHRSKVLMDYTLSNIHFADYPPSLIALASFLVAMKEYCADKSNQDNSIEEQLLTDLITHYHQKGGYNDLSCLAGIVVKLRSLVMEQERQQEEQAWRESHQDEDFMHVIPDC